MKRKRVETHLILFSGNVQRSVAVLGGRMRRCTFIQEKQSHILVVVVAGNVQRSYSILSIQLKIQSNQNFR